METPQTNPGISQISSMNAFYGIPITSPETTAAIERGAQEPEVYKPGSRETITPEQPQESNSEQAPASPLETYFSQTTEQLTLSEEAVAMQQQAATQQSAYPEPQTATAPETDRSSQLQAADRQNIREPEIPETPANSQTPATTTNETTAATALNRETMPEQLQTSEAESNQAGASDPLQTTYGSGPAASNASQVGIRFSAMG